MTEKPANQHNSEKGANSNEQFKRSTQYKTFNWRDLIRNQNCNFRHRNIVTTLTNVLKTTLTEETISETKIHKNIKTPENIPEDSLVDILAAIHSRTSSTETIVVPETQQTSESFLLQTLPH